MSGPEKQPEKAWTPEHDAALKSKLASLEKQGQEFLTPADVAELMHVTKEAVQQWIYRRKIPAAKLANGLWKIRVADFKDFLRAREDLGRKQILLTDGAGHGVSDLVQSLHEQGHRAIVAHNYPDAWLKALDRFPALFVITLSPRDPDSWAFVQKVRGHKALRSLPVLFIAEGPISEADGERTVALKAQGILCRPFALDDFKAEVTRILHRSQFS